MYNRSEATIVEDVPVHIASLDDLISMKRAANRTKDQGHLLELEAMRRLQQEQASD